MSIFDERENLRPYEYPHLIGYGRSIRKAFWDFDHFTYDRDVTDFKTKLTDFEQQVIERSMISIGVVENKVKSFWARIDMRLPKKEIADVGHTFAGNEIVHGDTYAELLELLGLSEAFETVNQVPEMQDRYAYLRRYLSGVNSRSNKEFTKSLILFSLLVENCSLFVSFLTVSSFYKYKNVLENFNSVITATSKEEAIHGKFGAELVNIIRNEFPEWFDDDMEQKVRRAVRKAYRAEEKVLNWVMEGSQLDWISKDEIMEFLKQRLNDSLTQMKYEPEYELDNKLLEKSEYMQTVLYSSIDGDFFNGKLTDYSKSSITEDSMW